MIKKVLTIAGSDCSGGAGIQADIKTITAHKMYAMSAITALTAQNTMGVFGIFEASPEFVAQQLKCIFEDIRPDAVKIGMVTNSEIIAVIADALIKYKAEKLVVDPVMASTRGGKLLVDGAGDALKSRLFPLAAVITPNLPEAEALTGLSIKTEQDMLAAARALADIAPCAVLIKGGHLGESANDLLLANGEHMWFPAPRIDTENTHGTGCTLSSAIACNLAAGHTLGDSVKNAKAYITGALTAGLDIGHGNGPLNHTYAL